MSGSLGYRRCAASPFSRYIRSKSRLSITVRIAQIIYLEKHLQGLLDLPNASHIAPRPAFFEITDTIFFFARSCGIGAQTKLVDSHASPHELFYGHPFE